MIFNAHLRNYTTYGCKMLCLHSQSTITEFDMKGIMQRGPKLCETRHWPLTMGHVPGEASFNNAVIVTTCRLTAPASCT